MSSNSPIPPSRLTEIATDACNSTFNSIRSYDHASTPSWNTAIINNILQSLIAETSSAGQSPLYKFVVNSTVIQHSASAPNLSNDDDGDAEGEGDGAAVSAGAVEGESASSSGKRGMHAASGAYWNNEKDGMWSFKYDGAEGKGFDVAVSVLWISIV